MDNKGWRAAASGLIGTPLVVLVGLTLVLAVGIIWGAKPSEQRIKIYGSVEACQTEQPAEDCATAFADAEQEQANTAPRFSSRDACEAQYGACGALPGGGDWFIPTMMGFILGHTLGAGAATSVVSQPIYVGRDLMAYSGTTVLGAYRSPCAVNPDDPHCRTGGGSGGGGFVYAAGGGGGGSSSSSSVWSSKSYRVEQVRTTVMRGGFGSSASSAPAYSVGGGDARNAISSSAVARGGFGSTASAHGVGA